MMKAAKAVLSSFALFTLLLSVSLLSLGCGGMSVGAGKKLTAIAVTPATASIAVGADLVLFSGDKLRKYLRKRPGVTGLPKLTASDIERIYTAAERTLPAKT